MYLSHKTQSRSGRFNKRSLLHIQVILLDGFEAVQSQVIVRLAKHSDLPRLELFSLRPHKSKFQLIAMMLIITLTRHESDLVVRRSLLSFFVSFLVSC